MTEIEEITEVTVQRFGGSGRGGGGSGRGGGGLPPVVWAFAAVLVAVVGLAIVGDRLSDAPAEPSLAAVDPSAGSSRSPRPSRVPAPPTPRPFLPTLPNMNLVGAPRVVLAKRAGDDLELHHWWPGRAVFELDGVIAGAYAGIAEEYPWVDLAPDGRSGLMVQSDFRSEDTVRSRIRLVGGGLRAWESDELPYAPFIAWSADSTTAAIGGGPVWLVVRAQPGAEPSVSTVRVAPDPAPSPSASGGPTPGSGQPRFPVPIAFSVDGRRLYGVTLHDVPPSVRPALQVDLAAAVPAVSPIDRYPTEDPDRLAPNGWPGETVDPATGRIAEVDYSGTRPAMVVFDPSGEAERRHELDDAPTALTWTQDGRLLASVATPLDSSGEVSSFAMHWIEQDGSLGPVVLAAERVNSAGPWTSRPGWMLIGFQAENALLFALLRTADGATATIRLRDDDFNDVSAIDLVDPLTPR